MNGPSQSSSQQQPAIAVQVTRSRISALGFTLALYLFSLGAMVGIAKHFDVPPLWMFITSVVPITIGFSLALASLVMFLISSHLDKSGYSEIWIFSVGELLMYLALAQTLSGGVQNFTSAFALASYTVPGPLRGDPALTASIIEMLGSLHRWLHVAGGLVWGGLIYVVPAVFLWRLPFSWNRKWKLIPAYVIPLLVVFWVSAHAYQIRASTAGPPVSMATMFVRQFWQPALWRPVDNDLPSTLLKEKLRNR